VVVTTEIEVTRARDGGLVMLERYEVVQAVADDSVPAAAAAFRQALTEVVARFLDDLAAANESAA
jgi:ABC-type uncharacterized transport system auxiliary subunit